MVDYPLGKRITRFVRFFVKHLDYEKEVGRLSATEFLISVFNTFPKNYLSQESTYFLVTMSPYLINESSTSCVKAISAALRTLLGRLNTPTATTMFKVCDSHSNLRVCTFLYLPAFCCRWFLGG